MSLSSPQVTSTIKKGPRQDGGKARSAKATPKTASTTTGNLLNIDSLPASSKPVNRKLAAAAAAANNQTNLSVSLENLNTNLSALPKIITSSITSLPTATTFNESLTSMLATLPFDARNLSAAGLPPGAGLPFGQHLKIDHKNSAYYLIPTGQLTKTTTTVPIIDPFNFAKADSSQSSRQDQEIVQLVIAFESLTVQLEKKTARPMDCAVKEHLLNLVDRMYKCLRQVDYDEEQASLSGNLTNNPINSPINSPSNNPNNNPTNNLNSSLSGTLASNLPSNLTNNLNNEFLNQIYGLNLAPFRTFTGDQPTLTGLSLKDLNNNNLLASIASLNSPVSINSPTTSSTTNQKQDDEEKDELFANGGQPAKGEPPVGQPPDEEDDLQKQLLGEEFMNSCDEFIIDHRKNINQNRIKSSIIGAVKHKQQNLIKKQQSIDDKAPINLTINSPLNSALASGNLTSVNLVSSNLTGGNLVSGNLASGNLASGSLASGSLAGSANTRRSIRCELCGTDFTQRNSLNRHLRSHTGEKPFPCKVCEKKFSDKQRLLIHTRIHTGEKPFSCQICDRSFTQKSTVKRHLIVHFGQGSSTTNPNFNNALNLKKKVKTGKTLRVSRKPSRRSKPDNAGGQDVKREQ